MAKILRGDDLLARARQLGVSEFGSYVGERCVFDEAEMQRRVMEAERHVRENRIWLMAALSALASAISAVAAWIAVLRQ